MPNIIEVTDLNMPELAVYTRLTEAQLRNKLEPEKGIFIAESPKVIGTALDAGCVPLSFLMERPHIEGSAAAVLARCPDTPVYTAPRETLQTLTGYALTRGCCAPCGARNSIPSRNCARPPAVWLCWKASLTPPTLGLSSAVPLHWAWTPCFSRPPAATRSAAVRCGSAWVRYSRCPGHGWGEKHRMARGRYGPPAQTGL